MKKFVKTTINDYLNENKSYSNDVVFKTEGDYEIDIEELNIKLDIINKYFPFTKVSGYFYTSKGTKLSFDNNIIIEGVFKNEPFMVSMNIGDNQYELDIHPFDSMGNFNNNYFENDIEGIFDEENTISLVVAREGYAITTYSVNKSELEDLKIFIVNGTQLEGKLVGETACGKSSFTEKKIN